MSEYRVGVYDAKHFDVHVLDRQQRIAREQVAAKIGLEVSPETFNPVLVEFYSQIGFVPESLNNYLLLLGWSLDDKTEEFTREEMIRDWVEV